MKLTVENLGAISHAEVDLSKDLIILTGENNTGKTYLAYVIYFALSNSIQEDSQNILEKDIKSAINQKENAAETIEHKLNKNIHLLFSTSKSFFKNAKFKVSFSKKKKGNSTLVEDIAGDLERVSRDSNPKFLQSLLNKQGTPFLIPAERQGINLFHKELSLIKNKTFDSLLQNGNRERLFNFLQTRFNKYALPIKDSLEFNQNLDTLKSKKGDFAYLADELDKSFLQGNIQIDKDGDLAFRPKNSKKTIDFHLTSSTVKSLSSLSIYLRYVAKKGDFIIIDEPEMNLHPNNQRKIARFISRLVNEGLKVMISTHSDYIIRELNSLIMLSSGKEKDENQTRRLQKKYRYNDNELLPKDKVGVYLFKQNKPVKKVKVNDMGFEISTIDKEVEKLNQSSQDIYFTLFD